MNQEIKKKLVLNKTTISNLNNEDMLKIKGGTAAACQNAAHRILIAMMAKYSIQPVCGF